ncbi:hypothetical protein [Halococcoides cellulosivorans]|uniref:Uncharacterized protein n=1 Tax=Halococcoides cellulosivorans TaxID=1679096 RepID=A0A2R4WYV9_9EURY|nr:hypothetical protein [Halococcoides cellulosivorans]AWB26722.1 hypothetical protein HARCEL1_02825 [Halococcoides cellulosivorans]
MTQVEERARLAAQREFPDADILDPPWIPEELERAIDAIRTMQVDDFADAFEDCYRYVTDPASVEGVSADEAEMIFQPFLIDRSNTVVDVPTPVIQYYPPGSDTGEMTAHDPSFRERRQDPDLTKFAVVLPPLEFKNGAYEFPDGFQVFVIEHLAAKVRDVFRHIGERVPEGYDEIDVMGHGLTADDPEYYDQHSP